MQVGALSESLEDYLEVIFRLQQNHKVVRVRDIARVKDVKTSSVVSALQRLDREDLIDYKQREYVELTENGRQLGFRLYQRHTFLKRFLTDFLQVDPETAERDACAIEHAISVETLERIAAMVEFLTYSKDVQDELTTHFRDHWLGYLEHARKRRNLMQEAVAVDGDAIRPLPRLGRGEAGFIARIIGEEAHRQSLIQSGVHPGASIRMLERAANGDVAVTVSGEKLTLDPQAAAAVLVWREEAITEPEYAAGGPKRTLADMTPGCEFKVLRITSTGEIRQRMTDMGFIRGATGKILREALLRDPIEVQLNGSLLSLRRAEASGVIVEELNA
jgi:DtxR family Mn-dependent transcriptional regulator